MTTEQDLAHVSPPRATIGHRPNRKLIFSAAGVATVGLLAGGWFGFLSPQESTVKLGADATSASPDKPIRLTGSVTPAASSRVIEISTANPQGGAFTPVGTTVTDANGRFAMTWSPAQAGPVLVRASADTLGRDQLALSTPVSVIVRAPAAITLKASATAIRTTGSAKVMATLAPAGGTITFEKSLDGTSWTPLAAAPHSEPGGASANLAGMPGGLWHIRATAAQTDSATAATAKEVTVLVEDYKAAGAKYLQIVGPGNKAIDKLNAIIDANASLSAVKKQAEVVSKAMSQEARDFRAYQGWPREVAHDVADIAKQSVVSADNYHMASQSRSVEEWNQISQDDDAASTASSNDAARIRDALGLPKRNLHP